MPLECFVPGQTLNPLNARMHWAAEHRYLKGWKQRTAQHVLVARQACPWAADLARPKRVMLLVRTRSLYDKDSGLGAACKGVVDGLKGVVIDDDGPTRGHCFEITQALDRRAPGVKIRIEPLEDA